MKRLLAGLLVVVCVALLPVAVGEEARYVAHASVSFHLRAKAAEDARRAGFVRAGTQVQVLEHTGGWCRVSAGKRTGYARVAWLERFISLKPGVHLLPGYPKQSGIARVLTPFHLAASGMEGTLLNAGTLLSVRSDGPGAPLADIMRETSPLPQEHIAFTPYTAWRQAHPGALIYGYTTYHNRQTGGRLAEARRQNIQLAVDRIQGARVEPDAQFSFNALCGPYLPSNGYVMGPNISSDGKGWGGGVCQVSTTLYNAALGLPIAVEKWAIHRKSGVAYVPQFFDASVGLYSDLCLRNLLPYAIRLEVLAQEGALTVLIYRAQEG